VNGDEVSYTTILLLLLLPMFFSRFRKDPVSWRSEAILSIQSVSSKLLW